MESRVGHFPSGRWLGWSECADHGRITLRWNLSFVSGRISGSTYERDRLVRISGTYEPEKLECLISQHYTPADLDAFRGFREGKGIWGTWKCSAMGCTGGFLIWPYREDEGAGEASLSEEPIPETAWGVAELVGAGSGSGPDPAWETSG